ncbi:MAG TPA: hypothetical protein DCM87_06045 [Planctomycetes bacterium]|nr:hypothetical protein [Planctomycetota bacterium]
MQQTEATHDSTIEDIHRTRRRIAEKFGGNLLAMIEDARQRQESSGHSMWRPHPPKPAAQPKGSARKATRK